MRHLYIHVPFCKRRCVYCDFAIAVRKSVPGELFVDTVSQELARRTAIIAGNDAHQGLDTIYFGGGTPSLLTSSQVAALIHNCRAELGLRADAEVTIEANPDDVTPKKVDEWLDAGINRVSIGVQSLDQAVLEWMHRTHDVSDGLNALRTAKQQGMESVSVDLIFGLPQEFRGDPVSDMASLIELEPDHVSVYGLTVEPKTPLARFSARGTVVPVADGSYADEFLSLHELLDSHDFEHYEISNYARPGRRSRHNSAYWSGASYLGLGPSAHSYTERRRCWNLRNWSAYQSAVMAGQDAICGGEELSAQDLRLEQLYLGLRTVEGAAIQPDELQRLKDAGVSHTDGWLRMEGNRLHATPEGWLRLDELIVVLTT